MWQKLLSLAKLHLRPQFLSQTFSQKDLSYFWHSGVLLNLSGRVFPCCIYPYLAHLYCISWADSSLSFSVSSQSQLEPASGMFTFFIRWPIGCFDNRVYDGYRLVPCSLRVLVGIEGVGWPTHHARTFEGLGRTLELSHFQNRHVHQGTNRQSTVWFA